MASAPYGTLYVGVANDIPFPDQGGSVRDPQRIAVIPRSAEGWSMGPKLSPNRSESAWVTRIALRATVG